MCSDMKQPNPDKLVVTRKRRNSVTEETIIQDEEDLKSVAPPPTAKSVNDILLIMVGKSM